MSMVGSLAFQQEEDEEDSNFFEQLANDLGDGDLGSLRQEGESSFIEGFSGHSIGEQGSVPARENIDQILGDNQTGDEFWLEDNLIVEAVSLEGSGMSHKDAITSPGAKFEATPILDGSGVSKIPGVLQEETPALDANHSDDHNMAMESLLVEEIVSQVSPFRPEGLCTAAVLSETEAFRDLASGLHGVGSTIVMGDSVGLGIDDPHGIGSTIELGDGMGLDLDAPHVDSRDPQGKDAKEFVEGASTSTSTHTLDALMNTFAGLGVSDIKEGSGAQAVPYIDTVTNAISASGVKEVQWSSFTNTFASNEFGSYSDFFMDLGDVREASRTDAGTQMEVYRAESTMPSPLGYQSLQDQLGTESLGSFDHSQFYETDFWNQQGRSDQVDDSSNKLQALDLKESSPADNVVSEAGLYSSSSANYVALAQNESQQQNWENAYPGWYFDYSTYQWRQIESEIGSVVVGESQSNGLSYVEADSSYMQTTNFGQGIGTASEQVQASSWSTLGSDEGSQNGMHATHNNQSNANHNNQPIANDVGTQEQVNWEEQYPGWYYDHQSQQWCQVPVVDSSRSWISNQSNIEGQSWVTNQGNIEASQAVDAMQAQKIGWENNASQSSVPNQSKVEGQLWVSNQAHIEASQAVDAMQAQKAGWTNDEIHSHCQSELNQSIYLPQSSPSLFVDSDRNTLARGMSFNSWTQSSVGILDAGQQGIENMKEGWHGGNANSWTGFQDSGQAYQPLTGYGVGQKSPFPTNPEGFFQPHNTSGGGIEGTRSSAGRPSHALVAFGFGGKLVTMKAGHFGTSEPLVLNDLNKLVLNIEKNGQNDGFSHFFALNRQGVNGPLVNGVSSKELLKWVDERTENCDSEDCHCTSPGGLGVLWGVLKIAFLHYGKLRSIGGSTSLKSQGEDGPEVALGRLLVAAKSQNYWNQGLSTSLNVLHSSLTAHQLQAAADKVRISLMDGKIKEALQLAQEGQLWGIALVLAWQLGEKVYADAVLHMAQQQFSPGSPLRTLLLVFAGQTNELFNISSSPMPSGILGPYASAVPTATDSAGGMLMDWLGNLSIIAANPTKGDEKLITHLGDSLWKEQGEGAGAHVCYLIAETPYEPFSKEARLCLVGADHFKYQRTFATPQAIQRTELYEYAKMLGNPQYVLGPFQPFKLLYAYMLAEAGKTNEALRYCQIVIKALKSSGRGSEIEFCKQSAAALEERLRLHSQGGYNLNFSTGKLVGKVMGTIDSTIHRIIGGPLVPPVPPSSSAFGGSPNLYASDQMRGNESTPTKVTPLIPSASNNNLFTVNSQVDIPARSVSEPNLMWSATQEVKNAATSLEAASASSKQNTTATSGGGYLSRFGSQFFAKAIGLIKHNKEAKLGDENKFYYDEKLKRWVESGVEQSTEEAVLAPPPVLASFSSSVGTTSADTKLASEVHAQAGPSASSDLPPMPPSVNQFSARGRLQGVRSRYVDTFNKGNTEPTATSSFQSPVVPAAGGGWGVASTHATPSQFFTPTSLAMDVDSRTHTRDGNLEFHNSRRQVDHEPLLPKNLTTSFMDVSLASNKQSMTSKTDNELANHRQSSASNLGMLTNNELASNGGNGGGLTTLPSLSHMPQAVSWSGEAQFMPSITGPYSSHQLPNGAVADAGSSRISSVTLPPPPIIEPPTSTTTSEKNEVEGLISRNMSSGSLQGVQYGEMQEVEL